MTVTERLKRHRKVVAPAPPALAVSPVMEVGVPRTGRIMSHGSITSPLWLSHVMDRLALATRPTATPSTLRHSSASSPDGAPSEAQKRPSSRERQSMFTRYLSGWSLVIKSWQDPKLTASRGWRGKMEVTVEGGPTRSHAKSASKPPRVHRPYLQLSPPLAARSLPQAAR